MNWLKIIFAAIGIVIAVLLGLAVIGFLYSALWYLFWLGVVLVSAYFGVKVFKKIKNNELEGRDEVSQIELDNAKIVKDLEDYKNRIRR